MSIKEQTMKKIVVLLWLVILTACTGCQSTYKPSQPLIGITSVYKVDKEDNSASTMIGFAYVEAVAENGGVPVVLPTVTNEEILQRYVQELDGLVLVGGADIPPSAYDQHPHETVKVLHMQRYNFERKLISLWLSAGQTPAGSLSGDAVYKCRFRGLAHTGHPFASGNRRDASPKVPSCAD